VTIHIHSLGAIALLRLSWCLTPKALTLLQRRWYILPPGKDGKSWHLPLSPLSAMSLEPLTTAETPHKDRLEAAAKMVGNHEAIVRFAARGAGKKGSRPVRAPLADPTATPADDLSGVCVCVCMCVRVKSV
jgi:hypothetical protein